MAKPNYAFAKRQRDLAKQKKREEKRLKKAGTSDNPPEDNVPTDGQPAPASEGKPE